MESIKQLFHNLKENSKAINKFKIDTEKPKVEANFLINK